MEKNCAYCEAGIADNHRHEAHVCIECGDEVPALDNKGWCVSCITQAHMSEEACIPPVQGVDLEALDRLTQFIKEAE